MTTMRGQPDALQAMFHELMATIPPLPAFLSDGDARQNWLSNLAQVVNAMTQPEQQWACLVEMADALITTRFPSLPLAIVYGHLAEQCGLTHVLAQVQAQHLTDATKETP